MKNSKKKNATISSSGEPLPKTAQDTIPFIGAYRNGIIESRKNFFTKAYKIQDINFSAASLDEQEKIYENYKGLISALPDDSTIQLIFNNKNADEDDILDIVLCSAKQDQYNKYRDEMNIMLRQKLKEGKNNIISEKYFVVGIPALNIADAELAFNNIDEEINANMKIISGIQSVENPPQNIQERLKCLHDILNVGNEKGLSNDIDFDELSHQGLSVKDVISPSGFFFPVGKDYFVMGDNYARTLYFQSLPSSSTTDFTKDLSSMPFNFVTSFYMDSIAKDKATKMASHNLTNIRGNVIDAQKNASRSGYSADLISPDLMYAEEQGAQLVEELRTADQRLFYFNAVIMLTAPTKEELDSNTASIVSLGDRYSMSINKLFLQQEIGFRQVLPLCRNDLSIKRTMQTNGVALFIPFSSKELLQKGGLYYGINPITSNLLIINRLDMKNQNGLILGVPGSGKSFAVKREMINVFLNTDDDIYVIDPESEYAYMATLMGGSVIHLEPGSPNYINPFDMDIHYGDTEDNSNANPVKMKSDYIVMLCETAMGGHYEISNAQKSIIDRVVIELYKPYLKHMESLHDSSITCDVSATPTMDNFYDLLMRQPEPEAQNIALSLEIYCRGSFDTFAHRTNVDINNRFTVYDIKNIGTGMKEIGIQVCLNHIWNKIIDNQKKQKRTWFYIDEFHVLTKTRSSSEFLMQIWKRARKWGGVPTAITQNVEDLMNSETTLAIISNCDFVMMLSQSPIDRASLASMYNISDSQLKFITNSPPGQGLIYNGECIIPFIDKFPQDTELYKIMSSKPEERKIV